MGISRAGGLVLAILGGALLTLAAVPAEPGPPQEAPVAVTGSGAEAYAKHCAACHGLDLSGPVGPNTGPALRGAPFVAKWRDTPPGALLALIRQTMPLNDPGSLDANTYAAISQFVRGANHLPVDTAATTTTTITVDHNTEALDHLAVSLGHAEFDPNDKDYRAARTRLEALAARLTPVSETMLAAPADGDWLAWRRSQGTSGFSPLRQIDRGNVRQLTLAWSMSLGTGTNALAPLVHDGVMFVNSNGTVRALDAATGDLIWEYARPAATTRVPASQSRGMALYEGSLFVPTNESSTT